MSIIHHTKLQINGPSGHCSHIDFHPPVLTIGFYHAALCWRQVTVLMQSKLSNQKRIFSDGAPVY